MANEKAITYLARSEEERFLLAHTADLVDRSAGSTVCGDFLSLGEQALVRAYLTQCGLIEGRSFVFFGGYPFAERARLFLFPEYISDTLSYLTDDTGTPDSISPLLEICLQECSIAALSVSGSGYKTLGHRDYLGALLSHGLQRDVIGDIAVLSDSTAVLFTTPAISADLLSSFSRIGADKVHLTALSPEHAFATPDTRRWEVFSDTVASMRLDALVAAAANLPRDRAKQMVTGGLVDVNFRTCDAPDTEICPGTFLSVRGHGRFCIDAQDGTSKKGRLRVRIKKLI